MRAVRTYNRVAGTDVPWSSAIQVISIGFDDVAASETAIRQIKFPTGMGFEITHMYVTASATTSDPALTIGSTAAGTQVVAAVNVTTDLGVLTIKEGTIAASGLIDVRVVADSGDAAESISLTIIGYPTSPPTTLDTRP